MMRALVLALVLAGAACAQMSADDETFVTKTYPALAELEWLIKQHPDRDQEIGAKAELAFAGLGKGVTDATNYRARRLYLQRVAANPAMVRALGFDEDDLKRAVETAGAELSPLGVATIDEILDASSLKTSARSTGGSLRPPPPPAPAPKNGPSPAAAGGIGAVVLLVLGAGFAMSRRAPAAAPEPALSMPAPDVTRASGKAPRPVNKSTGPQTIPAQVKTPAATEKPAIAMAKALAAKVEAQAAAAGVDPMARTLDMAFDNTAVYQPGQGPAQQAGPAAVKPNLSASGAGIPLKGAGLSASGAKIALPPVDQSKMNRTLPPYQPRGVSIRRQKKPPAPPKPLPPIPEGTVPDRYTVLSVLGKGGMGIVYKAYDNQGKREVALKTLSAEVMATDTARERFVREYETLNALDHPNIIKVYDMGCLTTPYFAMEFANGEDLGSIMLDDNVPIEAVLEIGIQLSNAMEYAHTEGVYHRDIKPSNLMITSEGLLKIVDFGLVKDTHASALTLDGTVLGSLRFMAPEQLSAEKVDARSDVYSVGMTLYYLLSGATPFDGNNPVVKLTQEPSSVLLHAPDADRKLAAAIDRSIRKDARDRWQSARELEDALRAISL